MFQHYRILSVIWNPRLWNVALKKSIRDVKEIILKSRVYDFAKLMMSLSLFLILLRTSFLNRAELIWALGMSPPGLNHIFAKQYVLSLKSFRKCLHDAVLEFWVHLLFSKSRGWGELEKMNSWLQLYWSIKVSHRKMQWIFKVKCTWQLPNTIETCQLILKETFTEQLFFFYFKSSNLYTGCGYLYPINLPTLTFLMGHKGS